MQHKSRQPRIDRSPQFQVSDDSSHLWAVSYADFLMVLLSFFVIFFSVNNERRESVIRRIASMTPSESSGNSAPGKAVEEKLSSSTIDQIKLDLPTLGILTKEGAEQVVFSFPDDVYGTNSVEMNTPARDLLKSLLTKLKPFATQLDFIFIGHSNHLGFSKTASGIIKNNYDLSSLRAARAINIGLEIGLPPDRLYTYGASDFDRNSKTLSLLIKPKGSGL